jgi:TIR domain
MAAPEPPAAPISLFYSYSHKDEALRKKLETHLSLLRYEGVIRDWHDRRIVAGTEWDGIIKDSLDHAGIILLLVSADFLASKYCGDVEVARAMEHHEAGTARVIPVILRPVDWHSALFGKLQALPRDGKAVTRWKNRDEAFTDIARGIREAARSIATAAPDLPAPARPSPGVPPPAPGPTGPMDRAMLVKTISGFDPGDMALFLTLIEGAATHTGRHGTVREQAAELFRWAESSTGPGLEAIRRALEDFRVAR